MSCTRRAVCSSLSLFSTSSRATAVLSAACRACSDSRICVARLVLVAAGGEREDAVDGVPELRHRAREILALLRRPRARRPPRLRASARRRDRRGSARTAPTTPSADTARRCRACRAWPAPSEFRSFWMRSSCSESVRLRSARSVCSSRRPEICRVDVPRHGHDGEQGHHQAEQQRGRRRSSFCSSARAHYHTGFGRPFHSQKM